MNNREYRDLLDLLHQRYLKAFYQWQDGQMTQDEFDNRAAQLHAIRLRVMRMGKGWARGYQRVNAC